MKFHIGCLKEELFYSVIVQRHEHSAKPCCVRLSGKANATRIYLPIVIFMNSRRPIIY